MLIWLWLACSQPVEAPEPPPSTSPAPPSTAGMAAPRIPADEPHWATMHGFQPSPQAYGEASWSDVRMRVAQHIAVATRDLARAKAMKQDWAGCATAYQESAAAIEAVGGTTELAVTVRGLLRAGANRDAQLCHDLATGAAPVLTPGTVAPLRQRLAGVKAGTSAESQAEIAADAARVTAPTRQPGDFANFDERHALRVAMIAWYVDAVDPFAPTDPWGPWTPAEVTRQARAIGTGTLDPLPVVWTAEEIGALPTGDTLVDTAGFAGPAAIGELSVLGLDDPKHRPWIDTTAKTLATTTDVPAALALAAAELDKQPYGSRYYNIKQLRNAGVRQLARKGDWAGALTVLATNFPLHAQDWACPNREGILRAIEGRLKLLAGDPGAEDTLRASVAASQAFLAEITKVGG